MLHESVVATLLAVLVDNLIFLCLVSLFIHAVEFLELLIVSTNVLIDHLIIKDLIFLVVLVVFHPFEQNSFNFVTTFSFTTAKIV